MNEEQLNQFKKLMITKLGTSDDASAQLVSDIVDSASGGGGGSLPKCTITAIDDTHDVEYYTATQLDNGLIDVDNIITADESYTTVFDALYALRKGVFVFEFYGDNLGDYSINYANLVNCTVIEEEPGIPSNKLNITDPTKDSSFTATIGLGGLT